MKRSHGNHNRHIRARAQPRPMPLTVKAMIAAWLAVALVQWIWMHWHH